MNNNDQFIANEQAKRKVLNLANAQTQRPLSDDEVIALFELNPVEWCEKEGRRMITELTERGLIDESLNDSQLNRAFVDYPERHLRFMVAHVTKTHRMSRRTWQMPIFYKALNMFDAVQWRFELSPHTLLNQVGSGLPLVGGV